jgi:HEAT repeat protein
MSVKIIPPFKVIPRIAEGEIFDPDQLSLKRLRNVVAGKDRSFSRAQAMMLLLASDFPNKHRDFEAVLGNEEEPSRFRYLAAISLGRVNTAAAMEVLVKHSQIRDERVLTGVMMALGRIGDKSALDVVSRVKQQTTGMAASMAKFAAALISHRLGLAGNDLPVPDDSIMVPDF